MILTDPAAGAIVPLQFGGLEGAVENASGPLGLLVIAAYSFLIAIVLPLPSEVVLVPAATGLGFGLSEPVAIGVIMLVSGSAKAAGSVVAFHLGHEAKRQSGPVIDRLRESRFDVVEWSERRTVELAREYGYIGLALALSVPFFPDTLSIYAFTVLEEDYVKFAAATFAGSVGRLLVTVGVFAPFFAL
ncbi:YqaA family protein [Halococcus saccharolyticus]|uniref:YqaA family protein n=1 Tax=Halococcus saccharolyticus TaxID=62319 RepID=UPI001F4D2A25|nr:VTT domain-containing protein [Halococcus saccharolyticus]